MEATIDLPHPAELDSGGWPASTGWRVSLYLIPAEERDSDRPAVTVHSGVGNIGTPMPAFHGRWLSLGGYGQDVVGESVRSALEKHADELLALADEYQGSEWDGSNRRGRWGDLDVECWPSPLDRVLDEEVETYWDAADFLADESPDWAQLCECAGVDPERTDPDAVAAVVEDLERGAADNGVRLARTEEAVLWILEEATS